jgi:L-amino acid N-acyltransferase YncA
MMNAIPQYPRHVRCNDTEVEIHLMGPDDEASVLAFARELPAHDLLFLHRDIRNPRVVAAWIEQIRQGAITSLLVIAGGRVVGCAAIVRDTLSWSPHVAELRVVISPEMRGTGLGRILVQDAFALAISMGVEKILARMTSDQRSAIAVFEEMGFRGEALLRDYVRDAAGITHDLVVLSLDVTRSHGQRAAFGYNEAF